MVIDEMSSNMLAHEKESADMAQKLTLMKNQMMEADTSVGVGRKFGAVRIGTIKDTPCTVSSPTSPI
jgi:hypothetical protein